ncbi:MAG TPA: Clp protease N-terminal domain-containing protein [Aggregatilinea sp.]|uniref:site-2 protease family protein n=1 Tax=Aggregatilinea sp. TaxID=2806333 RepID=UPI002CE636EC|nr:Clp protease N-terminal domain-containing protein [Aggregatilinea sp.]HML23033.1 Clp protease N-terminal domain-containing protein [Aggregatilinea sp.]
MSASQPVRIQGKITQDFQAILQRANHETALRHGHYMDIEYLLLGLLTVRTGPAYSVLARHGADFQALYRQVESAVGMKRDEISEVKGISRDAQRLFEAATQEAQTLGQSAISGGHLLLAMLQESDGAVREALAPLDLDLDRTRAEVRDVPVAPADPVPAMTPSAPGTSPNGPEPEVLLIPTRKTKPKPKPGEERGLGGLPARWGNWPWIVVLAVLFVVYLVVTLPGSSVATFALVMVGWIFSVTLHEFGHAIVAYWGGDYTVKDKGYLTFNPLKYTHPMLSIGLPLLFLAMGGIGLPGGAVYIEQHRLRSKWWRMAVSAAGPFMNLVLAFVLAAPFTFHLVDFREVYINHSTFWSAVAFLAMLQVTAVLFNLLPIPPLDGYGIIEPLLDPRTAYTMRQFAGFGILLVFLALWFIDPVNRAFWNTVYDVTHTLNVPWDLISHGFDNFLFWQQR